MNGFSRIIRKIRYLSFVLILAYSHYSYSVTPVDGTYRIINQPDIALPINSSAVEIEIVNDQIANASGTILDSNCSTDSFLSGGFVIDFGQLYRFQGFLSTIQSLGNGRFQIAENVTLGPFGDVLGISTGSFRAILAEIEFQTETKASFTIYSAYSFFNGNGLSSDSCLKETEFTLQLAE